MLYNLIFLVLMPYVSSNIATHQYEAMKLKKKGNTQLHSVTQQTPELPMSESSYYKSEKDD